MRLFRKEHEPEPGDGINDGPDPEFFCGQRSVNIAFDGEMMDQIRFFLLVDGPDPADGLIFLDRIQAFS